jgi:hypothetical protein
MLIVFVANGGRKEKYSGYIVITTIVAPIDPITF